MTGRPGNPKTDDAQAIPHSAVTLLQKGSTGIGGKED